MNDGYDALHDWWMATAESDLEQLRPKMDEYGSADLDIMGAAMAGLAPNGVAENSIDARAAGQEMALAFYLLGKVSRMYGAYAAGQIPSEDTIHDTVVYATMLRRVRAVGGWPH